MKVFDCHVGRLGNEIFRYFASTLFCILYKAERTYSENEINTYFNDTYFIIFMNELLNNVSDKLPNIDNMNYSFCGYYQHDMIFRKYKKDIINWILEHPNELLYTDGNNATLNYYNYNQTSYNAIDIILNCNKYYDVVIHLRLEDFIHNKDVIHPTSLENIIKKINKDVYCFVVNEPKTDIERKYIEYFTKKYNIIIESNDPIMDYQIMKNAKILVCSCSTLSWCSALMSEMVEIVYFPNYEITNIHATFKKPIDNTILYDFIKCGLDDLESFLSNQSQTRYPEIHHIYKKDPYCAINSKKEPITNKILEYIGNIKNGFYIEAGAYDGILQSNTKFLEEEYLWTGLLVEPSPKIFKQLQNNRPNNININKCLVSNNYNSDTIEGSFDNGPMSSVNNIRKLENVELIKVQCDTLENILNQSNIKKIDLMILDTEGYELQVLEGLNLNKNRPTYLLIEIYTSEKEKIFNYLDSFNYTFLENITNYNLLDNPTWDGTHNDYLFRSIIS
jgi:FkbM family methyltransferase